MSGPWTSSEIRPQCIQTRQLTRQTPLQSRGCGTCGDRLGPTRTNKNHKKIKKKRLLFGGESLNIGLVSRCNSKFTPKGV
jgi:hypothetical protein